MSPVVHGSDFRFIQIELGPHPLILFILDWAHGGYIVLAFPGDQWGHSFPSNVQAVMPASALAASGGRLGASEQRGRLLP